jgi:transcription-repair coupling factor (superfamily II helicase)
MSTATPSLALRALLSQAVERAGLSRAAPITAGLTSAAKALAAVAVARSGPGVTLLVVPTDRDVEQVVSDARFFYAAMEGASDAAVEQAVLALSSLQADPYRGMSPHLRVAATRARALHHAATGRARLIVASAPALLPLVSRPPRLLEASIEVRPGDEIDPTLLADRLLDAGFVRQEPVDEHGTFTIRGGIVDVFPAADVEPVRLEFVGDTVESLRRFDPSTQRSGGTADGILIVPLRERFDSGGTLSVLDFLARSGGLRVVVSEREQSEREARGARDQLETSYAEAAARGHEAPAAPSEMFLAWDDLAPRLSEAPRLEELGVAGDGRVLEVACQPARAFRGRIGDWIADLQEARARGDEVLFVAGSAGRAERAVELLQEYDVTAAHVDRAGEGRGAAVRVAVGSLSRGFRLGAAALQVYAEADVFEETRRTRDERRGRARRFFSDLRDLKGGDLVVHVDHGIGEFVGLKELGVRGADAGQEFLELRYQGEDKLFVPVERLDLIQKYTGGARPALDRLGGATWEKAKSRIRRAMRDMAGELLKLYAQRKAVAGHAYSPDTHWQAEFEAAFPYELTPDQEAAVLDVKRDMETPAPMDRLLCGDVGYGKTEVAVRAAFKAVMDGKQVAFLAPTTVLAFQHLKTLRERCAGFPLTIDMISRFRSRQEIAQILERVRAGGLDILVGTHRLLSKDVQFKDLGLLVVDEEQRFGVAHKERIKQLRKRVDVVTMTATPIPRTLNMSLVGIRDMSIIETPPKDRLSIQTSVVTFDASVIARAIRNELARGGQVYFVHNRVESIDSIAGLLQRLVPEARLVVGHGQMDEDGLERAMMGFVERRYDVLLATTIVENGLDIPNANTIIINRADRYGLAQLYQLRGRVGRSDRPAYAYLLVPPEESLQPLARKRLAAIKEFSDLGSGFRVAALDLEIRGAGNLLGGEQSGHIEAVGFEMYMKLLEQTIRELKGEEVDEDVRATVNLGVELKIDDTYVPDMNQRLMIYRRVAAARSERELAAVVEEIRDRYGALPDSVLNLVAYGRMRILADRLGIEAIDREGRLVVIRFKPAAPVDPRRLVRVVSERPGTTLVPPASLTLDLDAAPDGGDAAPGRRRSGPRRGRAVRSGDASWWTARATTGTVEPGFSRDQILRKPGVDPRSPGGLFWQLEGLLSALG